MIPKLTNKRRVTMAASQHLEDIDIIGSWVGFGRSQTWEGLKDMLKELRHFVPESPEPGSSLDHPNVYRNRTLNKNPRFLITLKFNIFD